MSNYTVLEAARLTAHLEHSIDSTRAQMDGVFGQTLEAHTGERMIKGYQSKINAIEDCIIAPARPTHVGTCTGAKYAVETQKDGSQNVVVLAVRGWSVTANLQPHELSNKTHYRAL